MPSHRARCLAPVSAAGRRLETGLQAPAAERRVRPPSARGERFHSAGLHAFTAAAYWERAGYVAIYDLPGALLTHGKSGAAGHR